MNCGQDFFNQLAERWDDMRAVNADKLASLVAMIGIKAGDRILDVGSGTGILLPFLKAAAGTNSEITALDFAANMVERAKSKHRHLTGITYVSGDIYEFTDASLFDKIVCLNFFPHAHDKPTFLLKLKTLLKAGGVLVIMHDISRAAVNAIHQTDEQVKNDRLPAGAIAADMLRTAGYAVDTVNDNAEMYFIKARLINNRDEIKLCGN